MAKEAIEAVYKHGGCRPIAQADINQAEGQRLRIVVEPIEQPDEILALAAQVYEELGEDQIAVDSKDLVRKYNKDKQEDGCSAHTKHILFGVARFGALARQSRQKRGFIPFLFEETGTTSDRRRGEPGQFCRRASRIGDDRDGDRVRREPSAGCSGGKFMGHWRGVRRMRSCRRRFS